MKFLKIIFVIIIFVSISGCYYKSNTENLSTDSKLETQENTEGPVSIKVIPKNISKFSKEWNFEIELNTHSEELTYDIIKSSVLFVDDQQINADEWIGDPQSGHHREGILKFILNKNIVDEKIELKFFDIGGVEERTFEWDLK